MWINFASFSQVRSACKIKKYRSNVELWLEFDFCLEKKPKFTLCNPTQPNSYFRWPHNHCGYKARGRQNERWTNQITKAVGHDNRCTHEIIIKKKTPFDPDTVRQIGKEKRKKYGNNKHPREVISFLWVVWRVKSLTITIHISYKTCTVTFDSTWWFFPLQSASSI